MKNPFFDLDATVAEQLQRGGSVPFQNKYLVSHYQKLENIERDLKRLPDKEEFFFLQTEKQFNAFTFIPFVIKHKPIKELLASTYSISIRVVESLVELYDHNLVEKVVLLVSDSLIKRNPTTIDKIESMARSRSRFEVRYTWNHSKITLARTDNDFFIVEGSGNWSENAAIEQYIFANCEGLYNFRKQIFDEWKKE